MRAYGLARKDHGCCVGHDKAPTSGVRVRNRKARNRVFRRRARALDRAVVREALEELIS